MERLSRLGELQDGFNKMRPLLGNDPENLRLADYFDGWFVDIHAKIGEIEQGVGGPDATNEVDASIRDLSNAIEGAFELLGRSESHERTLKQRYNEHRDAA